MRRSADPSVSTAGRYRAFAAVDARGLGACYEAWAAGVAQDDAVIAMIDTLPTPQRHPNLVFSAARLLGAPVMSYSGFAEWLAQNWQEVAAVCLSHTTQTNEAGRCAVLLPALAALPGPLALIEVGASAGLCLYPDRYSYRYLSAEPGLRRVLHPAAGESTVQLDCELSGPVSLPEHLPEVVWRAGIDLNPLDVANTEDVAWLDALIWPEHDDRRARLREAVAIVREEPPELIRGDLLAEVEQLVGRAPAGATVVVFHTAVLAYLSEEARGEFAHLMRGLPAIWLANEGQGVVPGVMRRVAARGARPQSSADFVLSLNGEPIAFTQPHGRALTGLPSSFRR